MIVSLDWERERLTLTTTQSMQFEDQGFLLVPGVLNPSQVDDLRRALLEHFTQATPRAYEGDTDKILFHIFERYPELRWLLFDDRVIEVLRDLLGEDFVVLREASAHHDFFSTWHKDTTSWEATGEKHHLSDDFRMVEVAFYLQDNSPDFGGGLDVEPGSQRVSDPFVPSATRLGKVRRRLGGTGNSYEPTNITSIPSCAGDMVIFDFRINHRATPQLQTPPEDVQKLAIFFACSTNTPHIEQYHNFTRSRASYVYMRDFSYSKDLLSQAKDKGVDLR